MAKKIFIYTAEEVKKMTPICKVLSLYGERTIISIESDLKSEV